MPLVSRQPPAEVLAAAEQACQSTVTTSTLVGHGHQFLESVTAETPPTELAAPTPVYNLELGDVVGKRGLEGARRVGWRHLVLQAESVIAATEVCEGEGEHFAPSATYEEGWIATNSPFALEAAEALEEVLQHDFEVRMLRVPALSATALWLHRADQDLLLPILSEEPGHAGTHGGADRELEANRRYTAAEYLARLRPRAERTLAYADPDAVPESPATDAPGRRGQLTPKRPAKKSTSQTQAPGKSSGKSKSQATVKSTGKVTSKAAGKSAAKSAGKASGKKAGKQGGPTTGPAAGKSTGPGRKGAPAKGKRAGGGTGSARGQGTGGSRTTSRRPATKPEPGPAPSRVKGGKPRTSRARVAAAGTQSKPARATGTKGTLKQSFKAAQTQTAKKRAATGANPKSSGKQAARTKPTVKRTPPTQSPTTPTRKPRGTSGKPATKQARTGAPTKRKPRK